MAPHPSVAREGHYYCRDTTDGECIGRGDPRNRHSRFYCRLKQHENPSATRSPVKQDHWRSEATACLPTQHLMKQLKRIAPIRVLLASSLFFSRMKWGPAGNSQSSGSFRLFPKGNDIPSLMLEMSAQRKRRNTSLHFQHIFSRSRSTLWPCRSEDLSLIKRKCNSCKRPQCQSSRKQKAKHPTHNKPKRQHKDHPGA